MTLLARLRWLKPSAAMVAAIGAALTPIIVAVVGNNVTTAIKEREVSSKFVELAVSILRDPPKKEQRELREWAVKIIGNHSGVEFPKTIVEDTYLSGWNWLPLYGERRNLDLIEFQLVALGYLPFGRENDLRMIVDALTKFQTDNGLPDWVGDQKTLELLGRKFDERTRPRIFKDGKEVEQ